MKQTPTFIPAKQRHRRKRHAVEAPAGLTITNVAIAGLSLRVYFSGDIVWDGVGVPGEFTTSTEDGPDQPCIGVTGTSTNWVDLEFNASPLPAAPWELSGSMAGITPAVAFPQSGTVS